MKAANSWLLLHTLNLYDIPLSWIESSLFLSVNEMVDPCNKNIDMALASSCYTDSNGALELIGWVKVVHCN